MDDEFAERLAEKLLQSEQALERLKNQANVPLSTEEALAAVMQVAEAADMMEELAVMSLQKSYEQALQESKLPRTLH